MDRRESLWRNKVNVLFDRCRHGTPVDLKRNEFPAQHFGAQVGPELEVPFLSCGLCIQHVACRRYSQREAELIAAVTDTCERNGSAMGLDFVSVGGLIVEGGVGGGGVGGLLFFRRPRAGA